MGCLPYFKFYAADWLADVLDLGLAERGAYITFIAWSWKRDKPLPMEPELRAKILGITPRQLGPIWAALEEHWDETPVGFVNPRLEAERTKARKRSESATASASARWNGGDC